MTPPASAAPPRAFADPDGNVFGAMQYDAAAE